MATECHNTLRPQLAVGRRVKNAEKRCGGVGTGRQQQRKAYIEVGSQSCSRVEMAERDTQGKGDRHSQKTRGLGTGGEGRCDLFQEQAMNLRWTEGQVSGGKK